MGSFSEFKEMVRKKGYGSSQFNNINGDTVYLSRGVREIFLTDADEEQKIVDIVSKFQNEDFGSIEGFGKEQKSGHEYGRYEITCFDEAQEDTAVWVHRTSEAVKVYFAFER